MFCFQRKKHSGCGFFEGKTNKDRLISIVFGLYWKGYIELYQQYCNEESDTNHLKFWLIHLYCALIGGVCYVIDCIWL